MTTHMTLGSMHHWTTTDHTYDLGIHLPETDFVHCIQILVLRRNSSEKSFEKCGDQVNMHENGGIHQLKASWTEADVEI